MSTQPTGLFPVSYEITTGKPGAPRFTVHLLVYTPGKTVNGAGLITQAVNPPLEEATILHGDFTFMTVMPKNTHILVTATGFPPVKGAGHGGITPITQPNTHLRMVLDEDWKSGTANFSFLLNGSWHEVENAPVKQIQAQRTVAA
jgi:hypothetical protein